MSSQLEVISAHSVTPEQARKIYTLTDSMWPAPQGSPPFEQRLEDFRARLKATGGTHATIWDGDILAAHARFFKHEILLATGPMVVGCLASVCTQPDYRHRGLGSIVVRAVFKAVDSGSPPVALFQTGVPPFYEQLGARLVHNRFVNSLNQEDPEGNPWFEPYAMIYPASFDWPEGLVDLKGRGW